MSAPITLVTGLPGSGKTQSTLVAVKEKAEKENRVVYYSGIPELTLPWLPLEKPEDWHKVPDGSIIVIDEAQRCFRPRGAGAVVPEHVSALETLRHRGFDLFLLTQHPMLLDANVRRLTGLHRHVVRVFGMARATIHEWGEINTDPEKGRADSLRTTFNFQPEAYQWYKSAEVHTIKRKVPARVWLLLCLPVLVVALGWVAVRYLKKAGDPPSAAAIKSVSASPTEGKAPEKNPIVEHVPRVSGLAFTAPVYDQVTRPVRAPYPAACVSMGGVCRCYTDQATVLDVPKPMCQAIVQQGFYVDWEVEQARKGQARQDERRQAAVEQPVEARPASSGGASRWPIGRGHWLPAGTS